MKEKKRYSYRAKHKNKLNNRKIKRVRVKYRG